MLLPQIIAQLMPFSELVDQLDEKILEYRNNPSKKTEQAVSSIAMLVTMKTINDGKEFEEIMNQDKKITDATKIVESMNGN